MMKPNKNAWLWWAALLSLSIGVAVYILLKPAGYDMSIQRYRSMALVSGIFIAGLCIIIGTANRWFGKDL